MSVHELRLSPLHDHSSTAGARAGAGHALERPASQASPRLSGLESVQPPPPPAAARPRRSRPRLYGTPTLVLGVRPAQAACSLLATAFAVAALAGIALRPDAPARPPAAKAPPLSAAATGKVLRASPPRIVKRHRPARRRAPQRPRRVVAARRAPVRRQRAPTPAPAPAPVRVAPARPSAFSEEFSP